MNIYRILKKSLPFVIIIVALNNSTSAQFIKMNLGIVDDATTASPVTFGVHPDATDGRDIALDENELPPFDPPGTLFAAFQWPVTEEIQKGYVDYRKRSDSATFKRTYRLEFGPYRKGKAKIIWTFPLPQGIDSVRIIDRRSNGVNVNFVLDNKQEFVIQNELWGSFLIFAYFNNSTVSVQENSDYTTSTVIYAGRHITSLSLPQLYENVHHIQLINIVGEICAEINTRPGADIVLPDNLAQGTYFLLSKPNNSAKTDMKTISIW